MSISPNIPSPQESYQYESTGTPRWIAVLFGVVIAALAVLGIAGYSAQSRIADLKSKMEFTTQKVGLTQSELAQAKSRAESIRKEQQASDEKLTTQLTQAQKENEEKIGAVATGAGGATKDLEATKTKLEATNGN